MKKFLLFLNEHRGKAALVSGSITAIGATVCCYGSIDSNLLYWSLALATMVACIIGIICFLFEAAEEWS